MPKVFTSKTQKIGELGEDLACRFLMKHGFAIMERNYTKKWGEIDIVAEKGWKTYFVEVKSKMADLEAIKDIDGYRPEENMHPWKLQRLSRVVQTYLSEHESMGDWQFDLLVVFIDSENKKVKVRRMENIVL